MTAKPFIFCIISLSLPLLSGNASAQCGVALPGTDTARGTVFVDNNNDGILNPGDTGIANVSISNGCDVVLTDAEGRYEIDIAALQILFISQPTGYTVAVDQNNVPAFYYRHYPDGTPALIDGHAVQWRFPVVDATGPLPSAINFPLTQIIDASTQFDAHAFADTQARTDLDQDKLREDLITTLIGNPFSAEFGITVGDVVYDNLELYDRHKQMMSLMDMPQWYLPGNHDLNFESPDARFADETYKLHFGPTYYSFNYGKVHFVALNNVEYAGDGQQLDGGERYRGYIHDDQLYWLERDLAHVPTDHLIVIASHIPLVSEADDGSGSEPATGPQTANFAALLKILEPFEHIYGIAGHDTSNSWKVEVDHDHGWHGQPWIAHTLAEVRGNGWQTGLADARGVNDALMQDGNPNGYYLLRFNDVEVIPEFKPFPFGPDANQHMRITLDPLLTEHSDGSIHRGELQGNTNVVVNLFDGGVRDKVWMSLNKGDRQAMTYTVRSDPFMEQLYERLQGTDQAIGRPTRSAHIWELPLPSNLEPGVHRLEVFSEDEFGQQHHGHFSFEILP
ncbi:hypothetical protein E3V39_10270 [Gammaproteobacteria bacterium LSUCC0112]|nr:hypothetical protein E3V39_10270 [Gammaproteobacteria bacterium LSUCC0112]